MQRLSHAIISALNYIYCSFFFFSSRRRHTRCLSDWSSDVCSSDLSGEVVPRGQAGELCTRGYSVMLGYWNNPEATHDAIDAARWMHTSDLATLDDEGDRKSVV